MIKKILILGGSGYLGNYIIHTLIDYGYLNITNGDLYNNNLSICNFDKIDILDKEGLKDKLRDYNIIINCTGQITNPFSTCLMLNSIGISNIIQSIGDNCRIIHISTVSVYGTVNTCDENSLLNPETNYATAKAFAEQNLLNSYTNLTILRLSNLYGQFQKKGLMAYIFSSFNSDRKLYFNNNGNLKRYFLHVEDCSRILLDVVNNTSMNGIFNVRGDEVFSIKALIKKFEEIFDCTFEKYYESLKPLENIAKLDDSKLRSHIHIKNKWSVDGFLNNELKVNYNV